MSENLPESNEPVASNLEVSAKPSGGGSLVKLLLPLIVVAVVAGGGWYFLQQQAVATQNASDATLKSLGVITIRDSTKTHVETITIPPSIAADKIPEIFATAGKMKWVKSLIANGLPLGDSEIEDISKLRRMTSLNLAGTNVTDAGISKLYGMPALETLILRQTSITSTSLGPIASNSTLRVLDISETDITGGLEAINKLEKLSWLLINGLKMEDDSIKSLSNNSSLSRLTMEGVTCDEAILSDLRNTRPDIQIETTTGTQ